MSLFRISKFGFRIFDRKTGVFGQALANSFGYEGNPIDFNRLDHKRRDLYAFLEKQLIVLQNCHNRSDSWWKSYRYNWITTVADLFILTTGDTRRPINDVTLLDQTAATVALFKGSLAQILMTKWQDPTLVKYNWRLFRAGIDSLSFLSRSLKTSDMLARQSVVRVLLDGVRHLVETEYPMGYELYRDETGAVFLVPDVANLLNAVIVRGETLSQRISNIAKQHLDLETDLHLFPITESTRNMLSFGTLSSQSVPEPSPSPKWAYEIETFWEKSSDTCTVCGLRPQGPGPKALSRNVCNFCQGRRTDRSKEWATSQLEKTIWLDEVADRKGRLALIVGRFGLEKWTSGELVCSLAAFDLASRQVTDPRRDNKQYQFDYVQLLDQVEKALKRPKQTLGGMTPLINDLVLKDARGDSARFGDIYDLYVKDSDLDATEREAWRFALAMLRQQPSAARIRRVWETTHRFWEEIQADFTDSIGLAGPRLGIAGTVTPQNRRDALAPYHAYELLLGPTKLSVAWDDANNRFISGENLVYISRLLGKKHLPCKQSEHTPTYVARLHEWAANEVKGALDGTLTVEEPVGYGSKNRKWGTIAVESVGPISDSQYTPAIPILAEPSTFMALLPADRAPDVVRHIKQKYECEMGKVRNRLPLHLGVVFADSRTPLRVILDAGKRMLKQHVSVAGWQVIRKNQDRPPDYLKGNPHFKKSVSLKISWHGHEIFWRVPLSMGDGSTDDIWYPYVFVKQDKDGNEPSERKRMFKAPNPYDGGKGRWLVHAADLEEGDIIYFTPATLDFQWLDTAGQRFEICYDQEGRRQGLTRRPYMLDHFEIIDQIWGTLSHHLTSTQVHAMRDLMESKREEWEPTQADLQPADRKDGKAGGMFWRFCRDVAANAAWRKGREGECAGKMPWDARGTDRAKWLDILATHAANGLLADAVELYLQIMKKESRLT